MRPRCLEQLPARTTALRYSRATFKCLCQCLVYVHAGPWSRLALVPHTRIPSRGWRLYRYGSFGTVLWAGASVCTDIQRAEVYGRRCDSVRYRYCHYYYRRGRATTNHSAVNVSSSCLLRYGARSTMTRVCVCVCVCVSASALMLSVSD